MLEIKKATEGDLDNMVALWLAPMQGLPEESEADRLCRRGDEAQRWRPSHEQIEKTRQGWRECLQSTDRGVLAAYEGAELKGFATYYHGYGGEADTGVTDLHVVQGVSQMDVAKLLLIEVGRQAIADGQSRLHMSIDHKESEMRNLILAMGGKQDGILGCCYTYYENFVWSLEEERIMALNPAMRKARLENEWINIVEPMNRPGFIEITHSTDYSKFYVTVHAPSYVVGKEGAEPSLKYTHKFTVYVGSNYPAEKPRVVFDNKDERIAHINVWDTGTFCIGEWAPKMCNIGTTISKCIHAIGFDPNNWRKDSMACSANLPFLEKKEREHALPTFDLRKIPLPGQKAEVKKSRFRPI